MKTVIYETKDQHGKKFYSALVYNAVLIPFTEDLSFLKQRIKQVKAEIKNGVYSNFITV